MKHLFDSSSLECSTLVTKTYSTSFSWGIRLLHPSIQSAIYAIYGFVRYADEIVDTFHDYDKAVLFEEFVVEYQKALDRKISLNPILNAFQEVVHRYHLYELVDDFLYSMRLDLSKKDYLSIEDYQKYIYGSADVVGLMCLRVFVKNNEAEYQKLKPFAMKLGSAFQKVNFLRDLKDDYQLLGRSYFPNLNLGELNQRAKDEIIADIKKDFDEAYIGIKMLPTESRLGVYLAYRYYLGLLKKLTQKSIQTILKERVRMPDSLKMLILFKSYLRYKVNVL